MPHPLYSVLAFTCFIVLLIFRNQFKLVLDESEQTDKDFLFLSNWVTLFCLQDGLWGFIGCGVIQNNDLFFISSTVFHAATAISAFIWLNYILNFIHMGRSKAIPAKVLAIALVVFQFVLLGMNFESKSIFNISENGFYTTSPSIDLLFYSQYFTFFITGLFIASRIHKTPDMDTKRRYFTAFLFIFAPILCGIFQIKFPFAPCNSIGSMLGCCIIYAFFITQMSRNRDLSQKAVIIAGLSSDYDLVVYVDLVKNQAKYYQVSDKFAPLLWEGRESTDPKIFDNLMRRIYIPNEMSGFIERSTLEKCIELLKTSTHYTIPFFANVNGYPEHYRLKIASDKSNTQSFIVGIINVEEEHSLEVVAKKLQKDLQHTMLIANKDPLTGVGSAVAFKAKCELINNEIKTKDDLKFAIIECDVNNLKFINDSFGHDMGSAYIKNCCKVFCNTFKHSPVFRTGGDEFVIILFDTEYDNRMVLFEKLKSCINNKVFAPTESISFAAGMADFDATKDKSVMDVFKRADASMYDHKNQMKNKKNADMSVGER